jgi:Mycoplasma protein of unknown function, DUF285
MSPTTTQPTPLPTTPSPTWAQLPDRNALRNAVNAARDAASNCNDSVYQTYGPMDVWDVSLVTAFFEVFREIDGRPYCTVESPLNLNNWRTSQVTSMQCMSQTQAASHIIILETVPNHVTSCACSDAFHDSIFDFQPVIDGWDTASVTDMSHMVRYSICKYVSVCEHMFVITLYNHSHSHAYIVLWELFQSSFE